MIRVSLLPNPETNRESNSSTTVSEISDRLFFFFFFFLCSLSLFFNDPYTESSHCAQEPRPRVRGSRLAHPPRRRFAATRSFEIRLSLGAAAQPCLLLLFLLVLMTVVVMLLPKSIAHGRGLRGCRGFAHFVRRVMCISRFQTESP